MSTRTDLTDANSDLLGCQSSAQFFGTVRTTTTNATSIYSAEPPFKRSGSDANRDLFAQSQGRRQSLGEHIPDRRHAIGLGGSTYDVLGGRRRERRSSELHNHDLSGVELTTGWTARLFKRRRSGGVV